jgi:hypothetical protein
MPEYQVGRLLSESLYTYKITLSSPLTMNSVSASNSGIKYEQAYYEPINILKRYSKF